MAQQGSRGVFQVGELLRNNDIRTMQGSGAPTNGTNGTGAGIAGPGSTYFRRSNGAIYVNTNTIASPTWSQLGSIAALTSGHIFVGNGSNVGTDVALSGDATLANTGALTVAPALIQHVQIALTAAQIKAMKTTPVQVLAAPGAGKAIAVHNSSVSMTYGTTQFAAGGVVSLVDHGTHNAVHNATGIAAATFNAAASFCYQLGGLSANGGTSRPINTAIDIEAATADFTTGDSTAKVDLWYSVITA